MHAETLCYMLHQLPLDRKFRLSDGSTLPATVRNHLSIEIPAGPATLGLPRGAQEGSGRFGWDNEFDQNRVDVPAFAIDAYNVTNWDFLCFILAGGYTDRSLGTIRVGNGFPLRDAGIPRFGLRMAIPGTIERCLTKSLCPSIGPRM